MMAEDFDAAAALDGVLPKRPAEPNPSAPRVFKPWHRPRKQWVRRFQWRDETVALLTDSHFSDDAKIFRYLSMPGEDLLDIRVLRDACIEQGLSLRYTGMSWVRAGSSDDMQLNLSESAVSSLAGVHQGSKVFRAKFQTIADPQSLASAEIKKGGPYNAINIDLCDHLAFDEQGLGAPTIIDAMAEIIKLQLRYASNPWVLFVTTRIAADKVNSSNLDSLVKAVFDNVAKSDEFGSGVAGLLQTDRENLHNVLSRPMAMTPDRFKDFFCLGFGKWLLSYMSQARPERRMKLLPSCFYSVYKGEPDMLSLAFRCDPIVRDPEDKYGILPVVSASVDHELDAGLAMLNETRKLFDLDAKLSAEPELNEEMIAEAAELLRSANYPVDDPTHGYRPWLAKKATAQSQAA